MKREVINKIILIGPINNTILISWDSRDTENLSNLLRSHCSKQKKQNLNLGSNLLLLHSV